MSEPAPVSPLFIQPASELTACPVEWLWPGRLALGKLALLDGDPGLGKSLIALDLCARLSTGRPLPDGSPGPGVASAVFINGEDRSEDTTVPRLQACGADLRRVYVLRPTDQATPLAFRIPAQVGLLDRALGQTGARLVVIDPLMAFLDSSVATASDHSVRAALEPVRRLAERHRCAVLFIRHLNKTLRLRALYRGGGSIGFAGACRSAWVVGPDPEQAGRNVLAQLKNNLGPPQPSLAYQITRHDDRPPDLAWLGDSSQTADGLLTPPRLSADAALGLRAAEFLRAFLAAGPKPSNEIWKAARRQGFTRRTLQRAMERAGITSKRVYRAGVTQSYWLLEGQKVSGELAGEFDLNAWLEESGLGPEPTPIDDL